MDDSRTHMSMTRRVAFSSGHRYWLSDRSEDENRRIYGRWASPFNHGHNYTLDVSVAGSLDPTTGMLFNIKDLDIVLQQEVVRVFDQKSINDEVPAFRNASPSLENVLTFAWDVVDTSLRQGLIPKGICVSAMTLVETPLLYAEMKVRDTVPELSVTRVYEFSASHRLHVNALDDEQNLSLFGKCNNPAGHGHNYILEVTVNGKIDPETGWSVDVDCLDAAVHQRVIDRYDHRHLNVDLPEYADIVPTSENIALKIFQDLDGRLPAPLLRVRLHETPRNSFEVSRA